MSGLQLVGELDHIAQVPGESIEALVFEKSEITDLVASLSAKALRKDVLHDVTVHISEAEVAPLILEGQLFVIDAKLVQERGVEVMHMNPSVNDVVAILIGPAVSMSALDATTRHPGGVAAGVMIASETLFVQLALAIVGSAEFAAPDHQRVIEQAALFQIRDESRRSFVRFEALLGKLAGEVAVLIPSLVVKLDKLDALFRHATSHQAIRGEGSRFSGFFSVEFEGGVRFLGKIGDIGNRSLHAKTHLVLSDPRFECGISCLGECDLVELLKTVQHHAARLSVEAVGIVEVENGIFVRTKSDTVMLSGKEAAAPEPAYQWLATLVGRNKDDEVGQVLIGGTKTVGKPGSNAGTTGNLGAGLHEGDTRAMVNCLGIHGIDHRDVIGNARSVWEQFAHPGSALSVLGELVGRPDERKARLVAGHAGEALTLANRFRKFLAVFPVEAWFMVEQVDLRRTTSLEEINDALGLWFPGEKAGLVGLGLGLTIEKTAKSKAAKATGEAGQ